jgi:tripartite-type tricarboxylate transporter receptor subunit TctC
MSMIKAVVTAVALVGAVAPQASAQSWPAQTVRFVTAQSAGSISDAIARMLADKLQPIWKQTVLVENRPGIAGTASVASAPADGYTLLLASNGHTISKIINKNIAFDPVADFAAVMQVVDAPLVMMLHPDSPAKTLPEWLELAKREPGKLNFGSAGLASSSYLAAETLRQNAKINIVHVPFRGPNEAVTAVLRGDVAMYFGPVPLAQELGAANKVRVIAISSAERNPRIPDVPTVAQAGLPDYKSDTWFGIIAPAATPKDVIAKVHQDVTKVLAMPEVTEALRRQGLTPRPTSPEGLAALMKSDNQRYAEYLKAAGAGSN